MKEQVVGRSPARVSLEAFLARPETKPASEYIDGKIHPKPTLQGQHSLLQTRLTAAINAAGERSRLVYAFSELRCSFGGRSLVPDIAVFY